MSKKIKIEYSGSFPNLCAGILIATIDGKRWVFPPHCLRSGGNVWFDSDWTEHIEEGEWSIVDWPEGFPSEHKEAVCAAVNENISHGCCGGCV